ncbi:MAG: MerR family transcriptional regulator [Solirubrobacterales bacterium]
MSARRTRTTVRVESDRGVFMISVAAELAEMHPQTLRMYEARGLITPKRSPKGTRLYSHEDVERLRRIQQMTTEYGLNLAGVERVLELERKLARAQAKVEALERRSQELRAEIHGLEARRNEVRADLVRYEHSRELARTQDVAPIKLQVERAGRRPTDGAPPDDPA